MADIFGGLLDAAVPYGGGLLGGFPDRFYNAVNGTFGFDPRKLDYQKIGQTLYGLDQDPINTLTNLLAERFAPAVNSPLGLPPLPPPTTVGQLPQGGAGVPQTAQPQLDELLLPKAAQPTQFRQPPTQAPQSAPQSPGFGDRLGAGFMGLTAADSPMAALGNLVGGLATGQRQDRAGQALANQQVVAQTVYRALLPREGHEKAAALAQMASQNPEFAKAIIPDALGIYAPPKTPEEVVARQMAQSQRDGGGGGSALDQYSELLRRKAAAEKGGAVEGETQATAQMNLPTAVAKAQEAMRLAESLRSHPGRSGNVWWHNLPSNYLPDATIPGNTDAFDANSRLFQLKSGAFAEAYAALKGGGQISNVEGAKMTESLNRMNRAASRKEFDSALADFEGILRLGIDRANQQAGKKAPYGFQGNQGQGVANGVGWRVVK